MKRNSLLLLIILLSAAASASAQLTRTVAVTGGADMGASFVLEITSTALMRTIEFGPLETDFTEAAVAALLIEGINDNFSLNGKTGFQARALKKSDSKEKLANGLVITATAAITTISIGPSGGTTSAPRAPGVAFNPTFTDYQSDLPTAGLDIQPQRANATLLLSGHTMLSPGDPSLDFFREVEVPMTPGGGGTLSMIMDSGANSFARVSLLVGPFRPTGVPTFGTPWGDVLELGNPQALGVLPTGNSFVFDGIFAQGPYFTDVNGILAASLGLPFSTVAAQAAQVLAQTPLDGFQGIFEDPTVPPLSLSFSAAVVPRYGVGRVRQLPLPQDGAVLVDFSANHIFDFYGQTFSQVTAYENGLLTFGPNVVLNGAVDVDPLALATSPIPAVFVNWADYDLTGPAGGSGLLRVYEFDDEVRISWGEPGVSDLSHNGDIDSAQLEVTMRLQNLMDVPSDAAGALRMDFIFDPFAVDGNDGVVGISPGQMTSMPVNVDLGLSRFAAGPMQPLLQQATTDTSPISQVNVASGGSAAYANGSAWNRRSITFYPPTFSGAGVFMDLYQAVPERARTDDFRGVIPGADQLSNSSVIPQAIDLFGYFQYAFDAAGASQISIRLDPQGALFPAPVFLTPNAIAAGSTLAARLPATVATFGVPIQFRDFEVLRAVVQGPLAPGLVIPPGGVTVDILVDFPGSVIPILIPNAVTILP